VRREALDAICTAAVLIGPEFAAFVPTVRKAAQRHRMQHEWFERLVLACQVCRRRPFDGGHLTCHVAGWLAGWLGDSEGIQVASTCVSAKLSASTRASRSWQ
jgi:hypothetical protein